MQKTMQNNWICGKTAIITGAALGIGAAYVRKLFEKGMKACTISDINENAGQDLAEEMNCCYGKDKCFFVKGDMTNATDFECVFKLNKQKHCQLDLVVNNAGILRDAIWEHMINLNCTSTVRGSLLGIKYMGKNNGECGGTIVNTASILGLQGLDGTPVYVGTKHFVIGFTRSIGTKVFYDLTNCRFMSICPGVTSTAMIDDAEKWVFKDFPMLGRVLATELNSMIPQTVEHLAEGLNTMLNEGENGSIWVGEEAKPIYEVVIPDRRTFKRDRGGGCDRGGMNDRGGRNVC